ncbi:MAG: type II toxin-antitoxin system HicA family toxin [Isosphaeraceae bacterium]
MNPRKLFQKALNRPKNLSFQDLLKLAQAFGFELARINGSHHILVHPDVDHPLNLQEVDGKAKPYQVRQLIRLVEENDLNFEDWQ